MPVTFTVVIPTHNRRERLLQAIGSVLRQSRRAHQIIVVADGCTDGSAEAVAGLADPRIEVLDLPKAPGKGWGHRNLALERATGDVVSYLGDDDVYLPDHLERVGALHDTRELDLVQAAAVLVWPDGRFEPWGLDWGVPWLRERFLNGEVHRNAMASVSHRRGLAEAAGGWNADPSPGVPGDVDLFKRIVARRPATAHTGEPTVLLITGQRGEPEARARQAQELIDRAATESGLALLRAELATAANRAAAEQERLELELYALREEHAAVHERAGRFMRERDDARAELEALKAAISPGSRSQAPP
jgi:hypothetical protein